MAKTEKPADEEIEIVLDPVEDKTDPEIVVAPQEDAPVITGDPPPKPVTADEGIEELRTKLAESERLRLEDAAARREAENRANQAGREVQDTQLSMVVNAIDTVKAETDRLEADYATALQDGDYAGAAKIQRSMTENVAKLQTLEGGRLHLEKEAKKPPPKPQVDIVEQLASQVADAGSPRAATWVRQHPQYARDPRLNRQMIRAHEDAVDEGIAPDTDRYFEYVENKLGLRERAEESVSVAAEQVGARTAPPAAPVGRGASNGPSSNPNTVRLSAAEREIAAMNGMTEREYAVQKLALQKEGKLQ
jgi:hypothetical protein